MEETTTTTTTTTSTQGDNQVEDNNTSTNTSGAVVNTKKCSEYKCPGSTRAIRHSVNEKGVYFVNRQCSGTKISKIADYCAKEIAATPTPPRGTTSAPGTLGGKCKLSRRFDTAIL